MQNMQQICHYNLTCAIVQNRRRIHSVQQGNQMIRTMYDSRRCIRWFAQDDSCKNRDDSRTDGDDSRKRAF